MKRGKPMSPGGFRRKVYEPSRSATQTLVAAALCRTDSRVIVSERVPTLVETFNPQPKFMYIRSPSLQVACRTIPCQHCLVRTCTEVWAHSNWAIHGKGTSVKASDQYVAALCAACHAKLDQGSELTERQRQMMWFLAHRATVLMLLQLGRWPAEVPVPNVIDYPF